jgi:hypothetical protein
MEKLDKRFETSDPEEKCKQCGHAQKRHYGGFCAFDGCDCGYSYNFAAQKVLFNLARRLFLSVSERVVRPFRKPPEL